MNTKNSICYASQWGFRCDSEIAKLICYVRDEYRAKYGCDYLLERIGKNKFKVISGHKSSFGIEYILNESKNFGVKIVL